MPWVRNDICTGCGICVEACRYDAITVRDDRVAVISQENCTKCGACLLNCPVNAIRANSEHPSLRGGGGNFPGMTGSGRKRSDISGKGSIFRRGVQKN